MEGLRAIRNEDGGGSRHKFEDSLYWFRFMDLDGLDLPIFPCAIAQIWPNLCGSGAVYRFSKEIPASSLADFFEHGYSLSDLIPPGSEASQYTPTGVKIAIIPSNFIPSDYKNGNSWQSYAIRFTSEHINIEKEYFAALWKALNAYPRLGYTISLGTRRFEFLGRTADNEGVSGITATHGLRFIFSVRQQNQSACFDARCILTVSTKKYTQPSDWSFLEDESSTSFPPVAAALGYLRAFKQDSHSPLYLPFVSSVLLLEQCRTTVKCINFQYVRWAHRDRGRDFERRRIEADEENVDVERLSILELVRDEIPQSIGGAETVMNNLESLWNCLVTMAEELPDTTKSEDVCRSNESILSALYCLRQELNGMREILRHIEKQINNFTSMRSLRLNQTDADRNAKIAQATRRDSSAMKTIAVLTMAFLPATFLAALFSMPSLNWDQPKHFVKYWQFTIGITAATFVFWAVVTQGSTTCQWLARHYWGYREERKRKRNAKRKAKLAEQGEREKKDAVVLEPAEAEGKEKVVEAQSAV